MKYLPIIKLENGECYSPTLVTTGRRDDRVVPSHSYKFVARIQEYQNCNNPVMLIDTVRAGHGSGGSSYAKMEEDRAIFLSKPLL